MNCLVLEEDLNSQINTKLNLKLKNIFFLIFSFLITWNIDPKIMSINRVDSNAPDEVKSLLVWNVYKVKLTTMIVVNRNACTTSQVSYRLTTKPTLNDWNKVFVKMNLLNTNFKISIFFQFLKDLRMRLKDNSLLEILFF